MLNVYPDIAGSDALKTWMNDPAIGFGRILVTPVSISNFNGNPNFYLKNVSGNYQYDVIMFGSWDANNNVDINLFATAAVRSFLDAGRGVLFGHDTQCYLSPNFSSLKDKTNLNLYHYPTVCYDRGGRTIRVVNDGFLLKYPHIIPYNANLTVPQTHVTNQTAKGVVWMNFFNATSTCGAVDMIVDGGTNNFYLTTWNNAAMIQTGHTGGQATNDERKIIANTLWYLAQFTTDTMVDACYARDVTPPTAPTTAWSTDCGKINISTCDSGTVYQFYVKATNMTNNNDTIISNTLTVENKTGLCGYFISEDNNPNGVPQRQSLITTSDCQPITYTIQNPTYYVHIQAMDCAGNLSAITTLKPYPFETVVIHDTICSNNAYKKHGFNIPANELQISGTFEFQDTIPSTTGCDTLVKLNLYVAPKDTAKFDVIICERETYQENGFNQSVSGKYEQYLQNRFGCDSLVILNLSVETKDTTIISDSICNGETYTQNGFNASTTGTYKQNLYNRFGCDSLVVLTLAVNPTPDIEITALSDGFCEKDFVIIQLITDGDSFQWNTGSIENLITITKSGVYTVTSFLGNCEQTATYTVEECPCSLWLPNAFTPNNDEINDVFAPVVFSNLANFSMYIYDRWGQVVYHTQHFTPWNGKINDKDASAGVYYCIIFYSCANNPSKTLTKHSSVTLIR